MIINTSKREKERERERESKRTRYIIQTVATKYVEASAHTYLLAAPPPPVVHFPPRNVAHSKWPEARGTKGLYIVHVGLGGQHPTDAETASATYVDI